MNELAFKKPDPRCPIYWPPTSHFLPMSSSRIVAEIIYEKNHVGGIWSAEIPKCVISAKLCMNSKWEWYST